MVCSGIERADQVADERVHWRSVSKWCVGSGSSREPVSTAMEETVLGSSR